MGGTVALDPIPQIRRDAREKPRQLKRLSRDVTRVAESGFDARPAIAAPCGRRDEIDSLTASFLAMSAKIRDQLERLRENDRLRRELITSISHDLRTPLSALQGYIETMLIKGDRLTDTERDRYLRIACKHSLRLGVLVSDLFERSKVSSAARPFLQQDLSARSARVDRARTTTIL